jgi:hypothetical protein
VHRSALIFACLGIVGVLAVPARGAVNSVDPKAASPAGVIYEIPVEKARGEGAPLVGHGGGGTGGSGGQGSGGASAGSQGPSGGGSPSATGSSDDTPAGRSEPSSIHSENGFGSSTVVPGVGAVGDHPTADRATGAGTDQVATERSSIPSGETMYATLGLALLAGGYVGQLALQGLRRRRVTPRP